MNKNIAIIDYGMGNICSVENAIKFLGANVFSTSNIDQLSQSDAYILPGVGSFKKAAENLRNMGFFDLLNHEVIKKKKPILGICLGMQLMAETSEEQGESYGLAWIKGNVCKLKNNTNIRVPHVGWSPVFTKESSQLFKNLDSDAHFYFDHSFHFLCEDKDVVTSTCSHGENFVASIQKNNIFATQFHPEKSQRCGLKLLKNYINYINSSNLAL